MATAAEIQTMIDEAKAQRHKVALGQAVIDVWRDGRRMRREITRVSELDDYISRLEGELIMAQLAEGITPARRRGAIGTYF